MIQFGKSKAFTVNKRLYRNIAMLYPSKTFLFHVAVFFIVVFKFLLRFNADISGNFDAIYKGKTGKQTLIFKDRVCSVLDTNPLVTDIVKLYYKNMIISSDGLFCLPPFKNSKKLKIQEVRALAKTVNSISHVMHVKLSEYLANYDIAYAPNKDRSIEVALTHGDFHQGNIKEFNDDLILIDWDFAKYRYFRYDILYHQYFCAGKEVESLKIDTWEKLVFALDRCRVIEEFNVINEEHFILKKRISDYLEVLR